MLLYVVVLFRVGVIGRKSMKGSQLNARGMPDIFPALLVTGLGLTIVLQAMINMGVCVGLLPVTGQTLPLVSMGGTSLLFTSASFGIILSIAHTFSAEGQAEEEERMRVRSEKYARRKKEGKYTPEEDLEEEIVDNPENGELPEVNTYAEPQRSGRRRAAVHDEQNREIDEDIDILENAGIPDISEELESEGREVLKELRKRGRRNSTAGH